MNHNHNEGRFAADSLKKDDIPGTEKQWKSLTFTAKTVSYHICKFDKQTIYAKFKY